MTTITIKEGKLSRTNFESLSDLQDYLTLKLLQKSNSFSDSFKAELNNREKELLADKTKGVSWDAVKSKISSKK
ncbi:MAG: hypothetical protein COB73_07305 [Flavobacteriaceae bacterium]|nr:MAG: hypothetical protein COB73_07305 [Flavobacteriaceae bacterium]